MCLDGDFSESVTARQQQFSKVLPARDCESALQKRHTLVPKIHVKRKVIWVLNYRHSELYEIKCERVTLGWLIYHMCIWQL